MIQVNYLLSLQSCIIKQSSSAPSGESVFWSLFHKSTSQKKNDWIKHESRKFCWTRLPSWSTSTWTNRAQSQPLRDRVYHSWSVEPAHISARNTLKPGRNNSRSKADNILKYLCSAVTLSKVSGLFFCVFVEAKSLIQLVSSQCKQTHARLFLSGFNIFLLLRPSSGEQIQPQVIWLDLWFLYR